MQTIVSLLGESCRRNSDRQALREKVAGSWQSINYGELWKLSGCIAAGLVAAGFKAGEHAALLAPSSPEWVATYLGILRAGGVVVPIDKELKSAELRHILTDSDARFVFSIAPILDKLLETSPDLPGVELIILFDPHTEHHNRFTRAGRLISLDQLCRDKEPPGPARSPHDTAVILYTSGTTGRSKGAMLSHDNIVSNLQAAAGHFGLDQNIHTLSFLPINHVFEQVCGVLLPLSLGGRVSFCESLKKLGENLAEVRPTFFLAVPAVYRMILDRITKKINSRKMTRLLFSVPLTRRLVTSKIQRAFGAGTIFISGGAALDPAVAEGITALGLSIYQGYGITETSPIISAERPGVTRLGTVGRLLERVQVRITEPNEDGIGEILVKGPNVMQGYYKNPRATAEVLSDGWYHSGDLGSLSQDGFLTISGRLKNLIVTPNGKNVYPEEVEIELLKSPLIAEVMVYGHKVGTAEEVHAIIYPQQEALDNHGRITGNCSMSEADVEALLREEVQTRCRQLADFKRVRKFTLREDEFPKTTTRKIKRFAVEASILTGP
ncbi:MAG TPA: AMP-binding protein [Desulfuromonadales bacterium]|nr:AMP-binding protein [Desulfuromonadales bacterium]